MTLYNYNESTNEILPTVDLKGVYNTNAFLVIVNKVDADSPAARAGIRRWVTIFSTKYQLN